MDHLATADEHSLAMECRASLANAAMMGAIAERRGMSASEAMRMGVEVYARHVAHALWMADERFDQVAFYAECGLEGK